MRVLLAFCFFAIISVAFAQTIGILSGAYSDSACTLPFNGLKPGILVSGACTDAGGGQWVKVTDKGTTYDAGLACTPNTCAGSCVVTANGVSYGACTQVGGIAYALIYKITEGTGLSVAVYDAAGCSGTARGTESYSSLAFPTACTNLQSTLCRASSAFSISAPSSASRPLATAPLPALVALTLPLVLMTPAPPSRMPQLLATPAT